MAQPEISPAFRAGWEAERGTDYPEALLQAAWDEYCGTSTPRPAALTAAEFVDDWNRMIAFVSETAEKHGLLKPDMVFHPEWLRRMRTLSGSNISGTLVHMGVRVKFATWQVVDALKEL